MFSIEILVRQAEERRRLHELVVSPAIQTFLAQEARLEALARSSTAVFAAQQARRAEADFEAAATARANFEAARSFAEMMRSIMP